MGWKFINGIPINTGSVSTIVVTADSTVITVDSTVITADDDSTI